jgi:hypothetical protein
VVARYRGLDLVVQAHPLFAADLSLALPGSATLDAVTAATDTGTWQSVGRTVSEISNTVQRLRGRIADAHERIATIDRELSRLEVWDGQVTYDAAVSELSAINAAFAAAEEQAEAEQGGSAVAPAEAAQAAGELAPDGTPLGKVLLALARDERTVDGWGEWQAVIPPAPASLAWMAAEVERQAAVVPLRPAPVAMEEPDAEAMPLLATADGLFRAPSTARVQFGAARPQRRMPKPQSNGTTHNEPEVSQLPLF